MRLILIVGLGSFLGGIFRFLLSTFIQEKYQTLFPYSTLTVNVVGCLIIGVVAGIVERNGINAELRMFLTVGVLGGFTTFSAFSNETFGLIRSGQYSMAIAYCGGSILLGLCATLAGFSIVKA